MAQAPERFDKEHSRRAKKGPTKSMHLSLKWMRSPFK